MSAERTDVAVLTKEELVEIVKATVAYVRNKIRAGKVPPINMYKAVKRAGLL